jgi:tetratricopeptide (TPR) repeat protein
VSNTSGDDRRQGRRNREHEEMLARLARVAGSAPVIETVIYSSAMAIATGYAWYAASQNMFGFAGVLAIHGAVCAMGLVWIWTVVRRSRDLRFPLLAVGSAAAVGPFGAAGSVLCALLYAWFRRSTTSFEEWYAALFPEQQNESARTLFQEIVSEGRDDEAAAQSIASFTDILAFGTFDQKQALLALIATYFRPAFAPALKSALGHPEPAIRVQAATAVAQIEQRFLRRSIDLDAELVRRPRDFPLVFAAARHYDDYAFTGLLDQDRQAENQRRAMKLYNAALELAPEDGRLEFGMGRLLVRMGEYRVAADLLAKAANAGRLKPGAAVWYLECLFRIGAFAKLREAAARIVPLLEGDESADPRLREAARLWAPV